MPLDSFSSSSAVAVPPAPSTARVLASGSPSSTAKVQAIVVEELARASMDLIEAEPEIAPTAAAGDVVALWARRRPRRKARTLDGVRVVKGETAREVEADLPARARALRVGVVVTAVGALVVAAGAVVAVLAAVAP